MTKVKVIIQSTFGLFVPQDELVRLLKEENVSLFSIEGRTNSRIIQYVEENSKNGLLKGKGSCAASISVQEVDTSKPWTISEYDSSEYIEVLDYVLIDKSINYMEKKRGYEMSPVEILSSFLSPIHSTTCSNKENCNCQIWHCNDCDGMFKEDVEDNPKCYFCDSESTNKSESVF